MYTAWHRRHVMWLCASISWMTYEVSYSITYTGLPTEITGERKSPVIFWHRVKSVGCLCQCVALLNRNPVSWSKTTTALSRNFNGGLITMSKKGKKGSKRKRCESHPPPKKKQIHHTVEKCYQRAHNSPDKQIRRRRWECVSEFGADRFNDVHSASSWSW